MPGFLVPVGTQVMCGHPGGMGPIPPSQTRVLVLGKPAATIDDQVTLLPCGMMDGTKPAPCLKVSWLPMKTRVTLSGKPALTQDMQGLAQGGPAPVPVTIPPSQAKVRGM
jgi:hypothetical protein